MVWLAKRLLLVLCLTGLGFAGSGFAQTQSTGDGWPTAGGDPGGQRYSSLKQINTGNVNDLAVAWTYHTRSIEWVDGPNGSKVPSAHTKISAFEATPILFNNLLYVVTPLDQVIALDPGTGAEKWRYDPHIQDQAVTSRGIAPWQGPDPDAACGTRVFLGTLDATLLAIDAKTGQLCDGFGERGSVNLRLNVNYRNGDFFGVTSPPAVVGNVVIVGSTIQDNSRADMEKGDVRAFDAVTGKLLWTWDPIPWATQQHARTGAGNAWSYLSVDAKHGLVYIPTGSASPDFYGGRRPGDNHDADSVVALEASSGRRIWGFQTTHHNLWDYDVASQPVLFTLHDTPAIAITTKMGMLFVLNRLTGAPLYPIEERPVPASDVPGETASPTQPFSSLPSLSPLSWPKDVPWGANSADDTACRQLVRNLRDEGIYTPPSFQGTLLYPGNLGGVNWGSPAFDPASGILYANTNRYAFSIKLIPRSNIQSFVIKAIGHTKALLLVTAFALLLILLIARRVGHLRIGLVLAVAFGLTVYAAVWHEHALARIEDDSSMLAAHFGKERGEQVGTPYKMYRQPLVAPDGTPCTPQPWGTVSAINLYTGKTAWQTPLGTLTEGKQTGTLNLGGPIVTGGGLVFTAASSEPWLHAFNSASGIEVWKTKLPVPAQSTPMTYSYKGQQYVVVSAGGHGWFGTPVGDSVIAYALPSHK